MSEHDQKTIDEHRMLREAKEVLDDVHRDLRAIREVIAPDVETNAPMTRPRYIEERGPLRPQQDLSLLEIVSNTIFRSMHGSEVPYAGPPREETMRAALAVAQALQEELGDDIFGI